MPNRVIKESIKTSKNVNALSDFQFRLWIHLILSADDFGRGNADPELIKNLAFPRRHGITEKQLNDALHVLANLGMVNLYNVDGEPYFYFPKWGEHQRIRQRVSKFPEPDEGNILAASCGELPQSAASCGELPQDAAMCGLNTEYRIQNTEYGREEEGVKTVLEKWNAVGVGSVRGVSGMRKQHLDARIREHGLATVLEAIDHVSRSAFLKGKNNRGWKISFDWFLNPNNFQKVLEGNYDSEAKTQKVDIGELLKGVDNI